MPARLREVSLNAHKLPFAADTMLAGLKPWIECESPTFDVGAVNRMMSLAVRDLAALGASCEALPGRMNLGDCVRARLPHARAGEPGILVLGHLDTVHPIGTLEKLPWRRDGNRCYGPGIYDMKGGIYLALEAVRRLLSGNVRPSLPITFLLTSDEEVGSPA